MPLLSEFARYAKWEAHAKRWKNRLYNRPVSHIIEYFIINFKNSATAVDKTASDHLKRQLDKKNRKEWEIDFGEQRIRYYRF